MPGLVPGIHVFLLLPSKAWMAGTSPAMTLIGDDANYNGGKFGGGMRRCDAAS